MRTIPAPATAALLMAAWLVLGGCSKSEHAATADPVPLEFSASYTRFRDAAVQVEMRDAATIIYRRGGRGFAGGPDAREEVVTVSAVQSARFRIRIDQAKLTEWKEAYRDPSLADGESWQVKPRYADFSAESMGANVFPEHGAYDKFTRAMHELIGSREFPWPRPPQQPADLMTNVPASSARSTLHAGKPVDLDPVGSRFQQVTDGTGATRAPNVNRTPTARSSLLTP